MTVDPAALTLRGAQQEASQTDAAHRRRAEQATRAAEQFESLVVRQLLSAMRKTAPSGTLGDGEDANSANQTYLDMFDDSIAEQISAGGGIGLSTVLRQSFADAYGVSLDERQHATPQLLQTVHRATLPTILPRLPALASGSPIGGATGRLQSAASQVIGTTGRQWSRDGRLSEADLASAFATESPEGISRFTVNDANGFEGFYKCNLFAFEVARRAGFVVPVIGRERGWGYPVPDAINADAADGALRGNWGRLATRQDVESLEQSIRSGSRAFMLSGSGAGDRRGHMAVVERVHEIQRDAAGAVNRIVFDGWEARPDGASHLARRTWNRVGNPGGSMPHDGFDSIEIIELTESQNPAGGELPISSRTSPGASLRDNVSSSFSIGRPKTGTEEQS